MPVTQNEHKKFIQLIFIEMEEPTFLRVGGK